MQTQLTNAKEPLERESARQFARQVGGGACVLVTAALLITIGLHGELAEETLQLWLGATTLVHLLNIGIAALLLKHLDTSATRQLIFRGWPVALFLAGLTWGAMPFIGVLPVGDALQPLYLLLLCVVSSLAVSTLCLHKPGLYAFITPVLLPTVLYMCFSDKPLHRSLGLGTGGLLALLVIYGQYLSRTARSGLQGTVHSQLLTTQIDGQVAELRTAWRALRQLSTRDPLTEVYNRRALMEHLEREMVAQDRMGRPLGLLRIDADQLRQVNETLGYLTGDEVLKAMARRIQTQLRGSDFLCRFESDTFVCVVHADSLEKLAQTAERVRTSIASRPLAKQPTPVSLTVCVGCTLRTPGETAERLMLRVTQALRDARLRGSDQVMVLPAEATNEEMAQTPGAARQPALLSELQSANLG